MTRQNVLACTSALLPMISVVEPITDASAHTNCLTKFLKSAPKPPKARGRAGIIRLHTRRSRHPVNFFCGCQKEPGKASIRRPATAFLRPLRPGSRGQTAVFPPGRHGSIQPAPPDRSPPPVRRPYGPHFAESCAGPRKCFRSNRHP